MIAQNGADCYAVIKLAQDTTKEELKGITDILSATTLDLKELRKELDEMPRIYSGKEPPPSSLKDGDIYLQYE